MADDSAHSDSDPYGAEAERSALADWPMRPWLLAGLLGLAGLLIHVVTQGRDDVPWQMAAAALLFFGPIAAAFTVEPDRWKQPTLFALAVGLVMAGLAWRAVSYRESLPDEEYGFAAGVVATGLALPLFQAGFLRTRLRTPFERTFYHVWTDAISAAGALAFTGLAWLALLILSELFHLLRIDLLRDLMEEGWFGWTFSGLAFGAALGTLRNQLKVLATLQSVVLLVLSLLAVPLAAGLAVFLLATAVSGPQVLWEATRSATPVLLTCAAGAFVLVNAILRDSEAVMTPSRIMRIAGWVLAAVILPLAVFAAVSMGLRFAQHGLSPERLWGFVAIVVAVLCGLAYWWALVRGRRAAWPARLREATFHLALVVCGLALLLALPVLDFGAISTRNQLARLQSGDVSAEAFDFAALRWDFGDPGRRALARLADSRDPRVAELAQTALAQKQRVYMPREQSVRAPRDFDLRVQPDDAAVRRLVLDHLVSNPWLCQTRCVALDLGPAGAGRRKVALVEATGYSLLELPEAAPETRPPVPVEDRRPPPELRADAVVEIREVSRRHVVVDGKPVGPPLDELEGEAPPR